MPKSKKPKDENAPKRAQSAYFLYLNERRQQLKASDPDKKVTEVSKLIGSEWNKLSEDDKKPYATKAKEEKAKYEVQLKAYKLTSQYKDYQAKLESFNGSDDGENESSKKKQKRLKDPNAPKKPQSSYFLFLGDRRPQIKKEHPDKKITEIAKTLGAEWKGLSASAKKKWEDKAAVVKAEYEKELAAYKKTDNYKKFQKKFNQQKLAKKKKKNEEESSEEEDSDEKPTKSKKTKKVESESESGSGSESKSDEESNDS